MLKQKLDMIIIIEREQQNKAKVMSGDGAANREVKKYVCLDI